MAASANNINQTITLTGGDEVRRGLEQIGQAGQKSGNQIRAMLLAATSGADSFTASTKAASGSSGNLRFALQNLSFQVNDVATSLASGSDPMRVFAQQGGQIVQAFQQGGGLGPVLSAAGAGIASFITPLTAAAAGAAALVGGIALFASRAAAAQASTRVFDVVLKATGQSSRTTGKDLEAAAEKLHDVGLSSDEARGKFLDFIRQGGNANLAPEVTRIGAELNKALGEGALDKFISAAAQGGAPLETFARQLGIVVVDTKETQKALDDAAKSSAKFADSISDAFLKRSRAIADEQRSSALQIADLTRQKGTAEEEITFQSNRRIQEIVRSSNQSINDLIAERNKENAAQLAAYNKLITDDAQAALDKLSLIQQIGQKVTGSFQGSLTPLQEAFNALSKAWNDLADTIAKSTFIQGVIADITELAKSITGAIKGLDDLTNSFKNVPALPKFFGGPGEPPPAQQQAARGGLIRGPGTGTSDSIPIWASAGEFIIRASVVRRLRPLLEAINRGWRPPGFAAGGLVLGPGLASALSGMGSILPQRGALSFRGPSSSALGGGHGLTLVIGAETIDGLTASDQATQKIIRLARQQQVRSLGRKPGWFVHA